MAEFCLFCMAVCIIVVFWEFFAAVGALLIAYVGCYLLVSEFNPEIDVRYKAKAEEYVQVEDRLECLILFDGDNNEQKAKLIEQRDNITNDLRAFITEKKLWKKYDRKDQEHGTQLAMAARIDKSEKDYRKRQEKEKKR